MKLFLHIGLAMTGLAAYALALNVVTLFLLMLTGWASGWLLYVAGIAALMGVDAYRIAEGKAVSVIITHVATFSAAVAVILMPELITWAL